MAISRHNLEIANFLWLKCKCKTQSAILTLWSKFESANEKMQIQKCKLKSADGKMQLKKCKSENANCKLKNANCKLKTGNPAIEIAQQ